MSHSTRRPSDDVAPEYLDPRSVSEFLGGVSTKTLSNWRVSGFGPPFVKIGRAVRYPLDDLRRWLRARTVRNTAEARR